MDLATAENTTIKSKRPAPKKPNFIIRWLNSLEQNNRKTYWITYTLLFLLMYLLMGLFFFVQNKTFICLGDGLPQQYTSFVQLGDVYREMLNNISSGDLTIPMFSNAVGYGNDVLLSLGSYFGNPLYLISVFAPPESADVVLNATVIVTLFLSGVFFTLFARNRSDNGWAILIGCMIYVFSGFSLVSFYQIHMIYPLMIGPLVFLGAELVFQHRSPVLLPIAMALLMMNAIDAAYECCILLFIYCLIRFFSLPEKPSIRSFFIWFGKFLGLLILAVCISAIIFLPCAYDLLNQDRIGLDRPEDLLYPLSYYYRLWSGFLGFSYVGSECFYGYFPAAMLAILVLFTTKKSKQKTALVILFVLLTIILLFPIFGKALNGFAYPNNRWSWAYSLLIGYIAVAMIPFITRLTNKQRKAIVIVVAVYMIIGLGTELVYFQSAFLCALIILGLLAACLFFLKNHQNAMKLVLLGSVIISCGTTYWLWLSSDDGIRKHDQTTPGQAYDLMVNDSPNALIGELEGDNWRYDTSSVYITPNSPIVLGKNGVAFYNSIYNGAIDELNSELGLMSAQLNITMDSQDSRLMLEHLNGVKYILTTSDIADNAANNAPDHKAPAGYDNIVSTKTIKGTEYAVLETDYLLPLAFTYDRSCSQESIAELSPIQKQDLMALEAILDNGEAQVESDKNDGFSDYAEFDKLCQNVPYTAKLVYPNGEEAEFASGQDFTVPEGGADLYISTDIASNKRAYLQVEGLSYYKENPLLRLKNSATSFTVGVSSGAYDDTILQTVPSFSLYSGKDTWAVNLGVSDANRDQIVAHFSSAGTYSIDRISVALEDEEAVLEKLQELGNYAASDIVFEDNSLTCNVSVPENSIGNNIDDSANAIAESEYLFVRLPYSEGWHATIDGVETEIIKANYGFMAVKLSAGEHAIEFDYETPLLRVGAILSALGIAVLIVLAVIYRKSKLASDRS